MLYAKEYKTMAVKITYFVHGTTYDNLEHKSTGWLPGELSPKGVERTLALKENTRDVLYKVIEQEGVSSIFNDEVLSYIEYMEKLSKHINMFIFDSLFFDVNYIKEVIRLLRRTY